jgi:hypothetical protein
MPKSCFAILAVAIAIGVSACGGGGATATATNASDSAQGSNGTGVSKAAFVKRANALCLRNSNQRQKALGASPLNPAKHKLSNAQLETVMLTLILPRVENMVAQLARLRPPDGEEASVGNVVRAFETAITRSRKEPLKAIEGGVFEGADEAAIAYGLNYCVV